MSRVNTVHPIRMATADRQPTTPLYHWLGADAEPVAASAGKAGTGPKRSAPRARLTIPLYHWLGAAAESVAKASGSRVAA